MLTEYCFAGQRGRFGLKVVARLTGPIVRAVFPGIVANVINGPSSRTPASEKGGNVHFRLRVVTETPAFVIDGPLHINHNQRRVCRESEGENLSQCPSLAREWRQGGQSAR